MVNVFVVIITYNGLQWLDKCIGSTIKIVASENVIIVDNGSADNTVSVIKKKYPQVRLLEPKSNLGFGKGNNIGIEIALQNQADYVYLLNQDAWLLENSLETMIGIHTANPHFGILSPMHVNADETALDYNFSTYLVPQRCPGFYSDSYVNKLKPVYELSFVNAAGWLISKECLEKVGFFDALFYHYFEDNNYCNRVLYHNLKIGICPSAKMVHDRPERKGVAKAFDNSAFRFRQKIAELADVRDNNFEKNFQRINRSYLFKFFAGLFTFKIKEMKTNYSYYKSLQKMKNEIIRSRERNKKPYTIEINK